MQQTILIADGISDICREALCMLVSGLMPHADVIKMGGETDSYPLEDVDYVDLILLKLEPPFMQGLNQLRMFRRRWPITPVLLISSVRDENMISMACASGASGFIHTHAGTQSLTAAIQDALAGKPAFPENGCEKMRYADYRLSSRQKEVLNQICMGRTNKEIGLNLNISDNTVRTHVAAIFRMLGVSSRTEVIILGRQMFVGESA